LSDVSRLSKKDSLSSNLRQPKKWSTTLSVDAEVP
jgi:hypothetical protein